MACQCHCTGTSTGSGSDSNFTRSHLSAVTRTRLHLHRDPGCQWQRATVTVRLEPGDSERLPGPGSSPPGPALLQGPLGMRPLTHPHFPQRGSVGLANDYHNASGGTESDTDSESPPRLQVAPSLTHCSHPSRPVNVMLKHGRCKLALHRLGDTYTAAGSANGRPGCSLRLPVTQALAHWQAALAQRWHNTCSSSLRVPAGLTGLS